MRLALMRHLQSLLCVPIPNWSYHLFALVVARMRPPRMEVVDHEIMPVPVLLFSIFHQMRMIVDKFWMIVRDDRCVVSGP